MCLFWDNRLDVGAAWLILSCYNPLGFAVVSFLPLQGWAGGGLFISFQGCCRVLFLCQGWTFSFSGVDFFPFHGWTFFPWQGWTFFPFQGGLFSFAGVDFFPLQEWTFFLFRGGLFPLQGGLFSSAGWPFLEERIRCRELPDYSVLYNLLIAV